jgi:large subunit ribosomal protein L18
MQKQKRSKIKKRIRSKIYGTAQIPRLFVFKSNQHIYASLVDDSVGKILLSFSDKKLSGENTDASSTAAKVGEELARLALKDGYTKAVFDRGGYRYHGKVKELAEGARKGGLIF